ncbi:MAG: carboxyl transferase domain-containing protein [Cellvibrionaceae bacterium]
MLTKLLIANRGEVAIRICRTAAEMNISTLAIYSKDDSNSLHYQHADQAIALAGKGASAYLDAQQILTIAKDNQCDAIHPGYGFLSENAEFAKKCMENGITFAGPTHQQLELFGDKISARQFAQKHNIPILPGTQTETSLSKAKEFFQHLNKKSRTAMLIKAIAGGGGRGMRIVHHESDIESAFERCQSEALSAFGNAQVYVEALIKKARHIEVQIIADNHGNVTHAWDRDCSIQRRHQKIIEVAPSPNLNDSTRTNILDAAVLMAKKSGYNNIGTFEFLVDIESNNFFFIEANPRLQVEHTITEEITHIDLVNIQLDIAANKTLKEIHLENPPPIQGQAIQARINMETMDANGNIKPQGGTIENFIVPTGPGVRVDTFGYTGYTTNSNFDSLLAKIICSSRNVSSSWESLLKKTSKALRDSKTSGVKTNCQLLQTILNTEDIKNWNIYTRWIDDNVTELVKHEKNLHEKESSNLPLTTHKNGLSVHPLSASSPVFSDEEHVVSSPLQGTIVSFQVKVNDNINKGDELLIIESMKMEHVITAGVSGKITQIVTDAGETLFENTPLLSITPSENQSSKNTETEVQDPHKIRPDLQEVIDRHNYGFDKTRPEAVAKRRKTGQRTTRENINHLCDEGSFIEYGSLVIAAQRARRSLEELMRKTPGDGLVGGMGTINAELFSKEKSQCVVMSYDYTVFAGTQGQKNHRKKDRLFELAEQWRLPVVIFTEGGGGRPGETERNSASGLDCLAFWDYAKLKGTCPLLGIVSGRCFAGNAVLLGCSDVIIATENANIGMGGPAMIEGGGLGVFKPEDVGPVSDHIPNGVIDIAVKDEEEAVFAAQKYLSYFQGDIKKWECPDQHLLRTVIPENRLRIYDVRNVIELLADTNSVLELRKGFAPGIVTSFVRIEGKAVGIVANNPAHLGGAIDSAGSDKAARFLQLCNAFNIPVTFLCDTPGIMVGPEAEKTALVRHAARLFIAGASLKVPFFSIILRKAYGLGAQTMAGGSFKAPFFTVSWPTGEFGGMGLEGAVKLGYRNEIAAIEDLEEREAFYQEKVASMYELGKAANVASYFDLDDVIDPKDTRHWIVRGLEATTQSSHTDSLNTNSFIDTW